MHGPSEGTDPAAELRDLGLLARDVTANRTELEQRLPPLLAFLGERLLAEHFGPVRMHTLRANRLLPAALRREGLMSLDRRDHAGAEGLLREAARFQEQAVQRLRAYAQEVPSLRNDVEEGERLLWTIRWELGKAVSGQGRWNQARALLAEVLDHVRLDGRHKLVSRDLDLVDDKLRQRELRDDGRRWRAALRGLRPRTPGALRTRQTPEGAAVVAAAKAYRARSPMPDPRSGRTGRAG